MVPAGAAACLTVLESRLRPRPPGQPGGRRPGGPGGGGGGGAGGRRARPPPRAAGGRAPPPRPHHEGKAADAAVHDAPHRRQRAGLPSHRYSAGAALRQVQHADTVGVEGAQVQQRVPGSDASAAHGVLRRHEPGCRLAVAVPGLAGQQGQGAAAARPGQQDTGGRVDLHGVAQRCAWRAGQHSSRKPWITLRGPCTCQACKAGLLGCHATWADRSRLQGCIPACTRIAVAAVARARQGPPPVPCMDSAWTLPASRAASASASRITACWAGPLGAVRLLLRPS